MITGVPDMFDPDRTFGNACRSPNFFCRGTGGVGSCQHPCSSLAGQDSWGRAHTSSREIRL